MHYFYLISNSIFSPFFLLKANHKKTECEKIQETSEIIFIKEKFEKSKHEDQLQEKFMIIERENKMKIFDLKTS